MRHFERQSPTVLAFPDLADNEVVELRTALSYKDPEIEQELKRLLPKHARLRYIERHGMEAFKEHVEDLKAKLNVTLLHERNGRDEVSLYETLSGFAGRLHSMGYRGPGLDPIDPDLTPRPYSLSYKPDALRYYQEEAIDALVAARHAGVSLPTGSGKSLVVERLVKKHGERAVVMAPSKSIAGQLHRQLLKAFGKGCVGLFGDGSKESKKDIVVGIAQSLTKADGEHARQLGRAKTFIADESHLTPASMFENVCLRTLAAAENRYFVSATQFRNDGTDILLEGITGPIVYRKTLEDLVSEGFLARPRFLYLETQSPSSFVGRDWHAMADRHIYSNAKLAAEAAALANKCRETFGHPVLILVDEVRQFKYLLPHLRHEVGFAHGPLNKDNRDEVDERFQKSDVDELVARFNDGQLPILVGTSCITTGTDLRPTGTVIYLMAGESEIKFWQAVGRGTRIVPGKTAFNFITFKIGIPELDDGRNMFIRHWRTLNRCMQSFGSKQLRF